MERSEGKISFFALHNSFGSFGQSFQLVVYFVNNFPFTHVLFRVLGTQYLTRWMEFLFLYCVPNTRNNMWVNGKLFKK